MHSLQEFYAVLFPAEDAESDGINNYKPDGYKTELRADIGQVFAFGC